MPKKLTLAKIGKPMRRKKVQPLGDILKDYLRAMNIDKKLKEINMVKSWDEIVGKIIANATQNIYIKDGKLVVYMSSAIIRNELLLLKTPLLEKINQKAGEQLITNIEIR